MSNVRKKIEISKQIDINIRIHFSTKLKYTTKKNTIIDVSNAIYLIIMKINAIVRFINK